MYKSNIAPDVEHLSYCHPAIEIEIFRKILVQNLFKFLKSFNIKFGGLKTMKLFVPNIFLVIVFKLKISN